MKPGLVFTALLGALLSVQGCATRDYGKQTSLTDFEKGAMSCNEIDMEINKTVSFVKQMSGGGERHGLELVAMLEDYWIGNSLAKGKAMESANTRMAQLWTLRDTKKCTGVVNTVTPAGVQSIPIQKPKVEEESS